MKTLGLGCIYSSPLEGGLEIPIRFALKTAVNVQLKQCISTAGK